MLLLISWTIIYFTSVMPIKIQKYCPESQVYFTESASCITANLTVKKLIELPDNVELVITKLQCNVSELSPELDSSFEFFITKDGKLSVPIRRWVVDVRHYLIEVFYDGIRYNKKAYYCSEYLEQLAVIDEVKAVRKCCGLNEMLIISPDIIYQVSQCIPRPAILQSNIVKFSQNESDVIVRFCETETFNEIDDFEVLREGYIRLSSGEVLKPSEYCMDDVIGGLAVERVYPVPVVLRCRRLELNVKDFDIDSYMGELNQETTDSYIGEPDEETTSISETTAEQSKNNLLQVPVCCPNHMIMNEEGICTESDFPLPFLIYLSRLLNTLTDTIAGSRDSTVLFNALLQCNSTRYSALAPAALTGNTEQTIKIQNRTLTVILAPPGCPQIGKQIQIQHYCVSPTITGFQSAPYRMLFHYCETEESLLGLNRNVRPVYPVLILCSTFCLALAIVVYLVAPPQVQVSTMISIGSAGGSRKRTKRLVSTLFGKLLVFHMGSLLLGFLSLGLVQVKLVKAGESGCTFMALWIYLSFTSAFAWLTVLCFELWWQFRETKASNDRRLLPYSIFGFGFPLAMTSLAATADLWSSSCDVRPHFNFDRCWFYGDHSLLIFFYGPISILVILNVVFFSLMVFNLGICDCFSATRKLSVQASSNKSNKVRRTKVLLAAKLFIVMGIPWITEIVAWAPGYYRSHNRQASIDAWYWYVVNALNAGRGMLVLLIFVLTKRHIRRFFLTKLGSFWKKAQPSERTSITGDNSRVKHSVPDDKKSRSNSIADIQLQVAEKCISDDGTGENLGNDKYGVTRLLYCDSNMVLELDERVNVVRRRDVIEEETRSLQGESSRL